MLSEQLSQQQRVDGFALYRVKNDPEAWAALKRLAEQLRQDIITRWTADQTIKRSWVNGALSVATTFIPAIEQAVLDSVQTVEEEKHAAEIARSPAEDGTGSGDLA